MSESGKWTAPYGVHEDGTSARFGHVNFEFKSFDGVLDNLTLFDARDLRECYGRMCIEDARALGNFIMLHVDERAKQEPTNGGDKSIQWLRSELERMRDNCIRGGELRDDYQGAIDAIDELKSENDRLKARVAELEKEGAK